MKAVQITEFGDQDVMVYKELQIPTPANDQVLVKLAASGVNFIDVYQRTGLYKVKLPYVLGLEGAGVIEQIGADVTNFFAGDQVAFTGVSGSYAEYALVPENRLVKVPEGIDSKSACAAMLQGMTAHYLAFSTYPVKSGDTCLVHAAAGGVGLLLVQMAKMSGATVFATVSTDEKAALAHQAGADEVIKYTEQDFEQEVKKLTNGSGLNVVYDSVGKDTFEKSLNCLKLQGYMVLYGQSSGPVPPFDPAILNAKGSLFLTRPSLFHYIADRQSLEKRAGEVLDWVANGKLKLRIEHVFQLSDATDAHRSLEGRKTTGKVLLVP